MVGIDLSSLILRKEDCEPVFCTLEQCIVCPGTLFIFSREQGWSMVLGNIGGGMATAFGILAILTVANTLTTYITPSKGTLQEVIDARTGLNTAAVV